MADVFGGAKLIDDVQVVSVPELLFPVQNELFVLLSGHGDHLLCEELTLHPALPRVGGLPDPQADAFSGLLDLELDDLREGETASFTVEPDRRNARRRRMSSVMSTLWGRRAAKLHPSSSGPSVSVVQTAQDWPREYPPLG